MAQMYIFTSVSDIILNVLAAACIRLCNVHCTPFSQIFTFFFSNFLFPFAYNFTLYTYKHTNKKNWKRAGDEEFFKKNIFYKFLFV